MSHYICRSLKIDEKEGKVYMTGTDNNVFKVDPHTGREHREFRRTEFPFFSRALQSEGRDRVEEYLAIDALDGNIKFQSGKFLEFVQWYWLRIETDKELQKKTSWRDHDYGALDSESEKLWKEEREKLLVKVWNEFKTREREPKKKYRVRVNHQGNDYFVYGITPYRIRFVSSQHEAKVFNTIYSGLFQRVKSFFGSENISIEEV
jgi:hypothetical protein